MHKAVLEVNGGFAVYARMLKSHLVIPSQELSEQPVVKLKYSGHQTGSLTWRFPSGHSIAVVVRVLVVVDAGCGVVGGQ